MSCAEHNVRAFQKAKARELISRFKTFPQECLPRPLHRKTNRQPMLVAAVVEDCFKRPHHESTNVFVHLRNRIEGPSKRNSARRIYSRCQRYTLTLSLSLFESLKSKPTPFPKFSSNGGSKVSPNVQVYSSHELPCGGFLKWRYPNSWMDFNVSKFQMENPAASFHVLGVPP